MLIDKMKISPLYSLAAEINKFTPKPADGHTDGYLKL